MSSNKSKGNNVYNFIGVLLCVDEYVCENGGRFAVNTKKLFQKFYSAYYSVHWADKRTKNLSSIKNLPELLLRSIFGTMGILCNFYAIDHLVLSDASMLNKLSPFFAVICSYFVLKEKVKPFQALAVIVAFIGALFIIKPQSISASLPSFLWECSEDSEQVWRTQWSEN